MCNSVEVGYHGDDYDDDSFSATVTSSQFIYHIDEQDVTATCRAKKVWKVITEMEFLPCTQWNTNMNSVIRMLRDDETRTTLEQVLLTEIEQTLVDESWYGTAGILFV